MWSGTATTFKKIWDKYTIQLLGFVCLFKTQEVYFCFFDVTQKGISFKLLLKLDFKQILLLVYIKKVKIISLTKAIHFLGKNTRLNNHYFLFVNSRNEIQYI